MATEELHPRRPLRAGTTPLPPASTSVLERAEQAVTLLRDLVGGDAVMLSAVNPFARRPRHELLVADGYSDAVLGRFLDDFVPDTANPGFRVVRSRVRRALRWSDLARHWDVRFAATPIAEQHLIPAGFREGITASLSSPHDTHVGAVHVSWSSARAATDDRRRVVERFVPLLAEASDLLQEHRVLADEVHRDAHVALIGADPDPRIPGRDIGPVLREDGPLWSLLCAEVPHRDGSHLWHDAAGSLHRITLTRCTGGTVLVAEHETPPPFDLTVRELQILTLLASGAGNPRIAEALVVSRRTVSTHVEHILAKLAVVSRTEAASLATREGLLLIGHGFVRRSSTRSGGPGTG